MNGEFLSFSLFVGVRDLVLSIASWASPETVWESFVNCDVVVAAVAWVASKVWAMRSGVSVVLTKVALDLECAGCVISSWCAKWYIVVWCNANWT